MKEEDLLKSRVEIGRLAAAEVDVIKLFGRNLVFIKIKKWKKVCSDA